MNAEQLKRSLSSQYDQDVLNAITGSDIGAIGTVIPIGRLVKEVKYYQELYVSEINQFFKTTQVWRETGDEVEMNDSLLSDIIGTDLTIKSLLKKIN